MKIMNHDALHLMNIANNAHPGSRSPKEKEVRDPYSESVVNQTTYHNPFTLLKGYDTAMRAAMKLAEESR
jgi:hypothetical protein